MAISKLKLGTADAVELRDDASLHFRGHFDYGLTAGANHTYTGTPTTAESGGTDLTDIRVNDFITYGAENLNIVCTDISSATPAEITWTLTSESTAENALSNISVNNVTGTVANHVASVTLYAKDAKISSDASTATADNTLPAGILTGTPTTDGELANKKYVDDSTTLAGHMKFKGTVGTGGDVTTLPLTTATAKVGDTYKVFVDGTYTIDNAASDPATQAAKVGDLFICKVSSSTATPSVVYTYVPSGDDVDVTSVGTSNVGITTDQAGGAAIETTGTISLKLKNGSTAFSSAAEAQGSTYRVCPVGVDAADVETSYAGGNLAVAIPAGTLASTVSDVRATSTAVASITNTTSTASTGSFLAGHVGTTTGVDDDTLYLDYITPVATTTNVVTKTS